MSDETTARLDLLERQQSILADALAALLSDHYQDGAQSAKGQLVALNPAKYESLPVQEKENLG